MRPKETINAVSISDWDEIRRKFVESSKKSWEVKRGMEEIRNKSLLGCYSNRRSQWTKSHRELIKVKVPLRKILKNLEKMK